MKRLVFVALVLIQNCVLAQSRYLVYSASATMYPNKDDSHCVGLSSFSKVIKCNNLTCIGEKVVLEGSDGGGVPLKSSSYNFYSDYWIKGDVCYYYYMVNVTIVSGSLSSDSYYTYASNTNSNSFYSDIPNAALTPAPEVKQAEVIINIGVSPPSPSKSEFAINNSNGNPTSEELEGNTVCLPASHTSNGKTWKIEYQYQIDNGSFVDLPTTISNGSYQFTIPSISNSSAIINFKARYYSEYGYAPIAHSPWSDALGFITAYKLPIVTITPPSGTCLGQNGVNTKFTFKVTGLTTFTSPLMVYKQNVEGDYSTTAEIFNNKQTDEITINDYSYQTDNSFTSGTNNFVGWLRGGKFKDYYTLIINQPPAITVSETSGIANDLVTCSGSNVTLSASGGSSFTWSNGATGPSINVNPITTTTYSVINSECPSNYTSKTITVNALPNPTISGSSSVCSGSIGNVYTTESGMAGYVWTVTGGTVTAGGNSVSNTATVTWGSTGTGHVKVNYTNGNGCTATTPADKSVTVNALPIPTISGSSSVCAGSTGNVYTTESGMTGYVWTVTGGTVTAGGSTTSNTITVAWSSSGTGHVKVGYTNGNGCTSATQTDKSVTVNALPIPTISGPANVCMGSTGNVYTTESSMHGYTWTVTGGTVMAGGSSSTVTVKWNAVGTGHVKVTYTNVNGCVAVAPADMSVIVNALPTPTINGLASVCKNGIENIYTTESGMTDYLWTVTGGTKTIINNTVTIVWNSVGTGHVKVNYKNENGCTAVTQTDQSVTVNALPNPTISGSTSTCEGSIGNMYTTETGMSNYIWEISGGTITAGGTATSNTATVCWGAVGTGKIKVNYTHSNNCTAVNSSEINVTINPIPSPTLIGSSSVCANSTGNVYSTETGMTNYTWEVTGGTITSGGTTSSSSATVMWGGVGTGTIKVNYGNSNSCRASVSTQKIISITTVPSRPISIIGNVSPCEGLIGQTYSVTNAPDVTFTWSVPSDWIITGGQGSNSVTVTPGKQSGPIMVTPSNTCGDGPFRGTAVLPIAAPEQPSVISGNNNPCQGSSQTYSVVAVSGINYIWTVPIGWSISSGQNTNTITVSVSSSASTGEIKVTPQNSSGCNGTYRTLAVSTLTIPSQPSAITGLANPCRNTSNLTYSVTNVSGITYNWTVPNGWSITSGQGTNSIKVTSGTEAGIIEVTPINSFGCSGLPFTYDVTTKTIPSQPSTISGDASPCQNKTGFVYSVTNISGVTYTWVVPTGWSITSGQGTNSITVTTGTTSGSIEVTPSNGCGSGTSQTFTVTTSTIPAQPSTIVGDSNPCQNTPNNIYSVTNIAGVNYIWTLPLGWTIVSGQGTNSITVTSGTATGNIQVTPRNICGDGQVSTLAVSTRAVPAQPSTITGNTSPCQGSLGISYSVSNITGVTYTWSVPLDWLIVSGQGTNLIQVNVGSAAGNITVIPSNGCGNGTSRSLAVTTITKPAKPSVITGNTSPCKNTTGITYSVTNIVGVNYIWIVPSDWSITAGQGTNTITVNTGLESGIIQVTPSNVCGDGTPSSIAVMITTVPDQPSLITGNIKPCQGTSGNSYSVTNSAGVTYTWAVPVGWVITSGQGSNIITVSTGTTSGDIKVVPSNACGSGIPRTFSVTTSKAPEQPSAITGSINPCQNASNLIYQIENIPGVNYTWAVPSDWIINSGQGTNSINITTGTSSGVVSVTPRNTCGNGTPRTLTVTVNIISTSFPIVTDVSCHDGNNGFISVSANGGTPPYQYSFDNTNWQTSNQFTNLEAKDYTFLVKDVNGCKAIPHTVTVGNIAKLSFNYQEVRPLCGNSDGSLTINPNGGTSPYEVDWTFNNQIVHQGNQRDGLTAGSYPFSITDKNGCLESFSQILSNEGGPKLDITTVNPHCFAGNDGIINLEITEGTLPYNTVLVHKGSTLETRTYNSLSEILPFNGLASGSYTTWVTDGNGCISADSIFIGTPSPLTATLSPTNISCISDSNGSVKAFMNGGTAPYTYNWKNGNGDLIGNSDAINNLPSGRYTLGVTDSHGCPVVLPQGVSSIYADIEAPTNALTLNTSVLNSLTCHGGSDGRVKLIPQGGWSDYTYSLDGITWSTNSTMENLNLGNHQVTVQDKNGCKVSSEATILDAVAILIAIDEKKDALCFGSSTGSITLSAAGGDSNYSYSIDNGITYTPNSNFTNLSSGNYNLQVIDGKGCLGYNSVVINQPESLVASIDPIINTACNQSIGSAQGIVNGGISPYLFKWSHGCTQSLASNLSAGSYALEVTDHNGCISKTTATINNLSGPTLELVTKANTSCSYKSDGHIEVVANEGTAPIAITWRGTTSTSSTIENLKKGNYTAIATDYYGCVDSMTVSISEPDSLLLLIQKQLNPLCYSYSNGELEVVASGGTSPYNYLWSNGSQVSTTGEVPSGTYLLGVTDSKGCLSNASYTLIDPPLVKPNLPSLVTICSNQDYKADAGIANATYLWFSGNGFTSNIQTPTLSQSGSYYLMVTDIKGCSGKDTITLVKSSNIIDANFMMADKASVGDTLVLIEMSWPAPEVIEWDYPASFIPIYSNDYSVYLVPQMTGSFSIGLTSHVGDCWEDVYKTIVVEPKKVKGDKTEAKQPIIREVAAFPNPNRGDFSVEVELNRESDVLVEVYSVYGKRLFFHQGVGLSSYKVEINLFQTPGIYFVRVTAGNESKSLRVMVE